MLRFVRVLGAAVLAMTVVPAFVAMNSVRAADGPQLRVISSRPDMVSGGDALVRVDLPAGLAARDVVKLTLNGAEARAKLKDDVGGRSLTGLVTGLRNGPNTLEVTASNKSSAKITLVNHPITGPLFAGPQEQPFVCMTDKFKLQGGGTLGPALDANCSIATRVDYVYRSKADGKLKPLADPKTAPADVEIVESPGIAGAVLGTRIPFIVRIETGTINRGIYQIAVLSNPVTEPVIDLVTRPAAWNGRLIYTFGGGCEPGWYQQGDSTGGVDDDVHLRMGYAVASNSLNVQGNNCGDVGTAETMAMTKEHFIEAYGVPAFTIGWGSSGGSTQQHAIAENYPGLLDGLITGRSFADGTFASATSSGEGRLFVHYFDKLATDKYTDEQIVAITGFPVAATIRNLSRVRAPRFNPTESCPEGLTAELKYDPVKNSKGARCDVWDHSVNVYGRDSKNGFARRPLDNVGIQYGLAALNAGTITVAQFLDINEKIGGFDIDGNMVPDRMVADPIATRAAYRTGRLNQAQGGMGSLPIIDYRTYYDDLAGGDVHMRFQTFTTHARLLKATGTTDNRVMLTQDKRYGAFETKSPMLREALGQMDQWLTVLSKDTSNDSAIAKIRRAKPAGLVDACWTKDETPQKIVEKQQYQAGRCNDIYPSHSFPRAVAGAPITNDIIKCQLRSVTASDYKVAFTADEMTRLKKIFPGGVCDWSKPGVDQQPLSGTWLTFNTERGTN
jgi:hypothetical protein